MRPLSYQPTSYEPLMIPVSPTSMERRTYDFEEDKKNGSSLAP